MLLSSGQGTDGRKLLIVGLEDQNVQRLRDDQPIERPLDEVEGLEGWTLYILGPEDTARFVARVAR